MNEKEIDSLLEELLSEKDGYVDDKGFTARVMHNLPARPVPRLSRILVLSGSGFLACLLAWFIVPMHQTIRSYDTLVSHTTAFFYAVPKFFSSIFTGGASALPLAQITGSGVLFAAAMVIGLLFIVARPGRL